jgi:hypothetical protein
MEGANMSDKTLTAALWYIEHGYSVIPIAPGLKVPPKGFKVEQYRKRIATPEEVKGWFAEEPNYNLALITGELSGVCAVDFDTHKPNFDPTIAYDYFSDYDNTPTVITPKFGRHLWYRFPDGKKLTINAGALPGIDFRGEGGYILVPPSKNGTGNPYAWVDSKSLSDIPLQDLPSAYINILQHRSNSGIYTTTNSTSSSIDTNEYINNTETRNSSISAGPLFIEGQRNEHIFHTAHSMLKGGSPKDVVWETIKFIGNNCNPKVPERELSTTFESAFQRASRRERSVIDEVRDFVCSSDGLISSSEVLKVLQMSSKQDRKTVNNCLHKLVQEGLLVKDGKKSGVFRTVDKEEEIIDWKNADVTPLSVEFPLDVHRHVRIHRGNVIVVAGESNSGKGHPHGTKILTDTGWKNVEDLSIGECMYSENGEPITLLNIFHRGIQECYKFTFNDGTSIETDKEHIWSVLHGYGRIHKTTGHGNINKKFGEYQLKTTNEIVQYCGCGTVPEGKRFVLPQLKPIQFKERSVPLNPYLVGVLLGDGGLTESTIRISSVDQEILDSFTTAGFKLDHENGCDYRILGMVPIIKSLNLWGLKSNQKFVPSEYLFNTVENRVDVLSGLLDSDGYITKDRVAIEFVSVSKQLADDVVFLVRSLGGRAVCSSKQTTYTHNGNKMNGQQAYRVSIKMNNICPFKLKRKAEQHAAGIKRDGKIIRSIEHAGEKETICLMVSNPTGLYVAKDFIITHNTAFCLRTALLNRDRFPINYLSSEMNDGTELRIRLDQFNEKLSDWDKIKFQFRTDNFPDKIDPEGFNIVDYLDEGSDAEAYKMGMRIRQIADKLKGGIAVVAIQKPEGRDLGFGGAGTLNRARLYLSISPGTLLIKKGKIWVDPNTNPNGMHVHFKLVKGCMFTYNEDIALPFTEKGWHH